MNPTIANRIQALKPSATLSIGARATELRASGQDVISLSLGEPDFPTPENVKKAGIKAIETNFTYYTAPEGMKSLREAIAVKFQRDNGLQYGTEQIIVSNGAKQCIYNACQVLLNQGDEVLIPAPYWVSYPSMVYAAEGKPVILPSEAANDFKITAKQLEAAITPKTKLLILNSPSNPTGMVYRADELQALAEVLLKHPHIYILSDDIYEHIYWADEPYKNIAMQCPELYERTIVINGVSKAYAMTGWRIGYAAGAEIIIKAMKKLQSQSTSAPSSISQMAAEVALSGPQNSVVEMTHAFRQRQQMVLEKINQIAGINCRPTQGAFYVFPDVTAVMQKLALKDDIAFAEYLLNEALVAVVPGTAFGAPGFIRISYAASEATLQEALRRIAAVC